MLQAPALKEIFEKKYERADWIKILRENFEVKEIYANLKSIKLSKNDWDAEGFIIGRFTEKDGREIGIYEVTINNNAKLERNKVGLRNLLKEVYENDVDAAFVVFNQKKKWRFSYVSEIKAINKETGKREDVKTDPKRYTYLMGEGERCKTAADRFAKLYKAGETITLKAIEDAFSVETLSKTFFEKYRQHYGKFTQYLTGKDENNKETGAAHPFLKSVFNGNEKDARDFIKKLMGRIVFLYFLEKKGWLGVPDDKTWGDGNENFLSDLFNDCKEKENFYQQVLVPLYFETLNEERPNDLFSIRAGLFNKAGYNKLKMPYLNGGLFDNDQKHTDNLVFHQTLFADLFHFFDQYNFTVYEDSPDEHTVAVDPEMLGHIFENLLEDNKDKGAFYTPKEIVHYMCRESLIEYLYTKLNPAATESYKEIGHAQTDMFGNKAKKQLSLEETVTKPKEIVSREAIEKLVLLHDAEDTIKYDEVLLKALKEVKICDPAIGSGAFPMGLLLEIFHLVETLYYVSPDTTADVWKLKKGWDPAKVKEEIIQSSIYGVDIEKGAVDIARLRFWLSLIVDETIPRPLPNLDYKIVVGNSLLSKFEDEVVDIEWNYTTSHGTTETKKMIGDLVSKLHVLQTKQALYFNVKTGKQKLQQEIRELKIEILIIQFTISKTSFQQNNPKLGGFSATPKEIQKNLENEIKIADFEKKITSLKRLKTDKNGVIHFFDWKLDFPEVMNEKVAKWGAGFDIVIGNPPYIQLQKLGIYADELQKRNFETFVRTGDIYCLFYEQGVDLLNNKGILTYITSNKWMRAAYGESLRKYFIENTNPLVLMDFGGYQVFDTATVDTNIIITQKAGFQNSVKTCVLGNGFSLNNISDYFRQHSNYANFNEGSSWVVLSSLEQNIKAKIEKIGVPLNKWDINIYRGILTGYNEAFIIDSATKDKLIASSSKSAEIIRPILRGRDIKRYSIKFADQWIINSHNGLKSRNIDPIDIRKDYTAIYEHFKKYKNELEKRLDHGWHWSNLRNCAYLNEFEKNKLVWLELTDKPNFALDTKGYYINNTIFFMTGDHLKYLLAFLNSRLCEWYFDKIAATSGVGTRRWIKIYIEQICVPQPTQAVEKRIIEIVDRFLNDPSVLLSKEIDLSIYNLFSLNSDEISFIESAIL